MRKAIIFTLGLSVLYLCGCPKPEPPRTEVKPVILGAFYFADGPGKDCLRQKLTPPQEPALGNYNIRKPDVIKQHLVWANQSGLSFFAVHWYGPETPSDNTVKKHLTPALINEKSPLKFCISYLVPFLHNTLNYEIVLDQPNDALFVKNMLYLARTYFNHPNYLRLNNRPVVFLYLSRFLKGDYAKTFSRLREIIRQATEG